jgi:putative ABC transport system permease protein
MKLKFKIAFRNILRQRGRTAVSLLMIAGAVVGLVIFIGFSDHILSNMKKVAIDNESGHLQVGTKTFWNLKSESRKKQLIVNPALLAEKISHDPEVESVSGRLSFYGLTSTGETTISAKGIGYDPRREQVFTQKLEMRSGHGLMPNSDKDVVIGLGLQKKMQVEVGGTITVLGYTFDGVINAMDLNVVGVFVTKNAEIDDNVFMMPIAATQTLLDTDRVEVLAIRLHDDADLMQARNRIEALILPLDSQIQIKTWYELATLYKQVESFYITQNFLIQAILLSLVFLGILNTIGMSVFERTGEIGTVRALGETYRSVVVQFSIEGLLLGVMGAFLGCLAALAIGTLISSMGFSMDLPGSSAPFSIRVNHIPSGYLKSMLTVIFGAGIATIFPALRASKMKIVEALRKNI